MKPRGRYIGWNVSFSLVLRLQAAAVCLLLLIAVGARPASAMTPTASSGAGTAHVYLLRGVLNIFSLGLDDIAAKLRAQGIPVTVANFVSWSSLADEAALAYKSGRLSGNAERYINFYIANGAGEPVTRTKDFHGKLDNVDVHTVPGVGHITIEKNQIMQQKVIGAIDSVVFGRAPSPAAAPLPQTSAAGPDARAAAATLRN